MSLVKEEFSLYHSIKDYVITCLCRVASVEIMFKNFSFYSQKILTKNLSFYSFFIFSTISSFPCS